MSNKGRLPVLGQSTKSTYKYVLFSVYHGTWQYMVVHGSTCKILSQYMTVNCSTISSLSRFMAVHGGRLQCMTRFAPGRGGGACPFWCSFESAALHAHPVALSSSCCMHKQVYSSFDSLASASAHPATRGFGLRSGFGRVLLANPPDGRSRLPRADPSDDGRSILDRWGFGWRRLGGKASGV
jgi:hypothetical protein